MLEGGEASYSMKARRQQLKPQLDVKLSLFVKIHPSPNSLIKTDFNS